MTTLEKMGLAAQQPGLVRAIEILQAAVDEIRAALAEAQDAKPARNGRPAARAYRASMSKEERSAEVMRRRAKSSLRGLKRGTPEYRAVDAQRQREIRAAEKAAAAAKPKKSSSQIAWDNMTARQRKDRLAKMAAAKAAKKAAYVNGEVAVA